MFFFSCSKDSSDSAGPSVDILSQSEQDVARILGPEIFTGIPGGQDTMKLSNTSITEFCQFFKKNSLRGFVCV